MPVEVSWIVQENDHQIEALCHWGCGVTSNAVLHPAVDDLS